MLRAPHRLGSGMDLKVDPCHVAKAGGRFRKLDFQRVVPGCRKGTGKNLEDVDRAVGGSDVGPVAVRFVKHRLVCRSKEEPRLDLECIRIHFVLRIVNLEKCQDPLREPEDLIGLRIDHQSAKGMRERCV